MKSVLARLGFLITLVAGGLAFEYGTRTEPLQSKNLEKLARITSKGGSCSGFKFDSGLILTAAHCIDRLPVKKKFFGQEVDAPGTVVNIDTVYHVDTYGDKTARSIEATVLLVNDEFDFALLTSDGAVLTDFNPHAFDISHLEGEKLDILAVDGAIPVSEYVPREFIVKGMQYALYSHRLVGRGNVKQGSSGGSVLNKEGKIAGIVSMGWNTTDLVGLTDARDIVREIKKVMEE